MIHSIVVFLWLLLIGSNVTQWDPWTGVYQGMMILAGSLYVLTFMGKRFVEALGNGDYVFLLACFAVPVFLMFASDRSFERGEYTSQIGILLVFMVSSVFALQREHRKAIFAAAWTTVIVGVAINLYELLIQNNVWSVAPGRSAGLYVNPNISGQALVGFGLVVLATRLTRLRWTDWLMIGLVLIGVFTTFSRTAIILALVLLTAVVVLRVQAGQALGVVAGAIAIPLVTYWLLAYAPAYLDLSPDAAMRIESLLESFGLDAYESDRGDTASASLELVEESPILGTGVRTIFEMIEGPHNMFIAMLVDYGIVGLAAYVFLICRFTWIGLNAPGRADRVALLSFVAWLVLFGMASHTMHDDPATLPLFGFAAALAHEIRSKYRSWRLSGQPA